MSNGPAIDFDAEARALAARARVQYVRDFLRAGMIDLALRQYELIDPTEKQDQDVVAAGQELQKARESSPPFRRAQASTSIAAPRR